MLNDLRDALGVAVKRIKRKAGPGYRYFFAASTLEALTMSVSSGEGIRVLVVDLKSAKLAVSYAIKGGSPKNLTVMTDKEGDLRFASDNGNLSTGELCLQILKGRHSLAVAG